jgi:hypothetical protein
MISPSVFREIRVTPTLHPYWKVVVAFLAYLRNTEDITLRVHGEFQPDDVPFLEDRILKFPYIHRWKPQYRRGVLAKFYQLEDWHNQNPSPVTMLTLTTYQDGSYSRSVRGKDLSIPESFGLLKNSWVYLRHAIKYYLHDISWCWIMEPHKTGYPHLHTVLFSDVSIGTQEAIKKLWAKKYKAGSYEHGVDFAANKPGQSIGSIRNYLMKYLAKGFTSTGSKFGEGHTWSAGELVFNALVWKNGWRLFGASRDLCKVMAYHKKTDEAVRWYATELLKTGEKPNLVWILQEPTGWKNHTRVYR